MRSQNRDQRKRHGVFLVMVKYTAVGDCFYSGTRLRAMQESSVYCMSKTAIPDWRVYRHLREALQGVFYRLVYGLVPRVFRYA